MIMGLHLLFEDKTKNFKDMLKLHKALGFQLMLDEAKFIRKKESQLAIIGVENWGKGFKQKET